MSEPNLNANFVFFLRHCEFDSLEGLVYVRTKTVSSISVFVFWIFYLDTVM